jgi:tetratricopeptide (TPR) repeat protein
LAGLGDDGKLTVWRVADFQRLAALEDAFKTPAYLSTQATVRWCNDKALCVSCPQLQPAYFVQQLDGEETTLQRVPGAYGSRGEFRVPSPGGRWMARAAGKYISARRRIDATYFPGLRPEVGTAGMSTIRSWDEINELRGLAWSPDARVLAAIERDHDQVSLVPTKAVTGVGETVHPLLLRTPATYELAWSPGPLLALLRQDNAIQLVDHHGQHHGLLIVLDSARTIFIHPNGHASATAAAEKEILYVVEQEDGIQATLSPEEFAAAYEWENQPHLARLNRQDLETLQPETPSPAVALVARGVADRDAGHLEEAIAWFQRAVDADSDFVAAWLHLADGLKQASRMEESRECLLAAARITPVLQPLNLLLGQALADAGRHEAARIQFEHARENDAQNEVALAGLCRAYVQLADYAALDSLAKTAEQRKEPAPVIDYWRGVALFHQDKPDEAAMLIEKAAQQRPQNFEYLSDAVMVFKVLDRQEKVTQYLQRMKAVAQQHCEQEPGNAQWRAQLALIHIELGEMADAVTACLSAATLAADNADYWNTHAWIVATIDDPQIRDADAALESARKACDLTGMQSPACLDTLAAALAATGRFEEAIQREQQAIQRAGDDNELLAELRQHLESYQSQMPLHLPVESYK